MHSDARRFHRGQAYVLMGLVFHSQKNRRKERRYRKPKTIVPDYVNVL
jgi:hypothetical protein